MQRVLYVLWILSLSIFSNGQEAPSLLFKHLNYKDGLSDPIIQTLHMDRNGFLWIGTHNGLNRFDGSTCFTFLEPELQGNMIMKIFEDEKGNLWVGTQKGLSKYDSRTGKFTYQKHPQFNNYYAYPFFANKEEVWLNMAGGIFRKDSTFHLLSYDTDGKTFLNSTEKPEYLLTNASHAGLFIHQLKNKKIVKTTPVFREQNAKRISDVKILNNQEAWVATPSGVALLNYVNNTYKEYELGFGVNCLWIYKNWLFLGTSHQGLKVFDTLSQKIIGNYQHEVNNPSSLAGNEINGIVMDVHDNLFVGVVGKGVSYTNLNQVLFNHILGPSDRRGMQNNITAVLQLPSGEIWCGTNANGIVVYDSELAHIQKQYFKNTGVNKIQYLNPESLFVELKSGQNQIYHPKSQKWQTFSMQNFPAGIHQLVYDTLAQKTIVATPEGLGYLDNKLNFEKWDHLNQSLEWVNVCHWSFFSENEALVQTYYTNMYWVKRKGNSFELIREIQRTPFNINESIKIKDQLYLATTSGLFQFDIPSKKLHAQAIIPAYCTAVTVDHLGTIWVNTNSGLYQYKPSTHTVNQFTEADGLQGAIFNSQTLKVLKNKGIVTGGSNGLNYFKPENIHLKPIPINVFVSEIKVNDHLYTEYNPIYIQSLKFKYQNNTISFKITPVDYKNPYQQKIKYQLIGYDNEPLTGLGPSEIRYAKLPPGDYTFKVWNDEREQRLILKIIPPFWRTNWFYILGTLLLIAAVGGVFYAYGRWVKNNELQKLRIMLNSQEEERKRIALDLHDDLGGRLSSLKLYMQATSRGISDEYKSTFKDTTGLLDEAISELRNILNNLSPKALDENGLQSAIYELCRNIQRISHLEIETYLEDFSTSKEISYVIYRICQELFNNTLKYAEASQVMISLLMREDGLVFLYEDNGKGFEIDKTIKGYGLHNMETHAQAIHATITIDSSIGKGVAVTLVVPPENL